MASEEELKAEIEKLRAENESLKKPARGQVSLKVSEKGGLFRIWPWTLSGYVVSRAVGEAPGNGGSGVSSLRMTQL
jgi:hypothetical protein